MQKLLSASLFGILGHSVDVEVDVSPGMGQFTIVGLGDVAVQESKERVRSAIKNSGFKFPSGARITVNLAPADLKKRGPHYDLPIALGILGKEFRWQEKLLQESMFIGELALNGELRPIHGALSVAIHARDTGIKKVFLPKENLKEASVIPDIEVIGISSLQEITEILQGNSPIPQNKNDKNTLKKSRKILVNFSEIIGQDSAKRALLIAAAGGHNILMQGPPGSGKTMLAKALAGILPPMDIEEQIEVSQVYSVAGILGRNEGLVVERPFRSIHHTASEASIIGGGRDSRPGEISLAHKGVLFLDEFLEFDRHVLETLRQPVEDGEVVINRVNNTAKYPSRFMLVGSLNPCPCGFLGDSEKSCRCSAGAIEKYRSKLSGPLIDRIDIYINVPRIRTADLKNGGEGLSSEKMQQTVIVAKQCQQKRFEGMGIFSNSEMSNKDIEQLAKIKDEARNIAISSTERLHLSTRVYYRILRVARTIADIEQSEYVEVRHIAEAISYRG